MTREEAIDILKASKLLWTDAQREWFYRHPNRCVWAEQWITSLHRVDAAAARAALADLQRQVDPFSGRWQFVGQLLAQTAAAHTPRRKTLTRQAVRREPPPAERARDQLAAILALKSRGIPHDEACRQVLKVG